MGEAEAIRSTNSFQLGARPLIAGPTELLDDYCIRSARKLILLYGISPTLRRTRSNALASSN